MGKNEKLLKEFVKYCKAHPEERFWQALRNWSGYPFILKSNVAPFEIDDEIDQGIQDTFYKE